MNREQQEIRQRLLEVIEIDGPTRTTDIAICGLQIISVPRESYIHKSAGDAAEALSGKHNVYRQRALDLTHQIPLRVQETNCG
jgi:hypothetical protein